MDGISMFRSRRQAEDAVAEMRSWTGRSKMSGVNLSRLSRTATRSSICSPHSANVLPRRISACSATPFMRSRSSGSFLATEHGHLLRFLRFLAGQQPCAVPGAGGRRPAETAQFGGPAEPSGQFLAVPDVVQHAALEPDRRGRRRLDRGQLGERLHGLVRRAAPALADVVQRGDVVHEGVAVLGQGGVQVAQLRFERLLVAHDRPDQLALELQRGCVAGQLEQDGIEPERLQLRGDLAQAGAPVPHHQDGLALVDEGADGVDGGLGLAGARRAADHERVPRPDGVHDILLVRVGVEQQQFLGRVALIGAREAARP